MGQGTGLVDPAGHMYPLGHARHVVAPDDGLNVPIGHGCWAVMAVALQKKPAAHVVQAEALARGAKDPTAHAVSLLRPVVAQK